MDTFDLAALQERVLVLAPFGRDAELVVDVLTRADIASEACSSIATLCERLDRPAGVVLLTQETITPPAASALKAWLTKQEPWSDLPIILLTTGQAKHSMIERTLELFEGKGNFSLLERPFHIVTLVSAVKVALRARRRQFQVRDLMRSQDQAVRERDEFLSVASHELKTPITSLKLQVQMRRRLIEKGDASALSREKIISLINTTEKQLERLTRLVEDMLDISRIVNGKLALNRGHIELGELVTGVYQDFSSQFEVAGYQVNLNINQQIFGHWDRYRIEQVVANLFSNAIKYGANKPISVTVTHRNGKALLLVKDQGHGIAKEDQTRIFQRFERVNSKSNVSGLGLGLYITKQILELHDADISVESDAGRGSLFCIALPADMTMA